MKRQVKAVCRLSIVACLIMGCVASWGEVAMTAATNLPSLFQPVVLRDADGNAEHDLVDPFRRRGADDEGGVAATGEDGLMRTTMGEISSDFRILAITIPQDTNTPRAALIQFHDADEPVLVHQGDLVRVDRSAGAKGRGRIARTRPRTARPFQSQDADLEEQLKKFVFYVNVKHIEATFIEVYHNKKRPDETIRLNW